MMVTFWILTSLLTVLTLGLLLWPLLRRSSSTGEADDSQRRTIYRQQFLELEQDHRAGILPDEQYEQARHELERRLLEEAAPKETAPAAPRPSFNRRVLAGLLLIAIPLGSILLYLTLGTPLAITHPRSAATMGQPETDVSHRATGGLDSLAERLRQRLEQGPADGAGWALLARSYVELERHTEAVSAFEKAAHLLPDDAQLLADYADALGVVHGRKLEGKPETLITRALAADPRNVKALMLAGTVAFNRKEYGRAATYWEEARGNLPPDADQEVIQELTNGIAEARDLGGTPTASATAARPSSRPTSSKSAGLASAITGTVSLAPELTGKVAPSDTLFVFARSVDGPPMPVAIVRASRKDLPFAFRLDDNNSPMPSRKLSEAGPVMIVARLSKSGEAMPKSGDLQGMSQTPVRPGMRDVAVLINQLIP